MANGYKICNLYFDVAIEPLDFEIDGYKFLSYGKSREPKNIFTNRDFKDYYRKHKVTSKVFIPKRQKDSLIFKGGRITNSLHPSWIGRKRKFLEDILLVISLLVGRNVVLYSRYNSPQFPALPTKYLKSISSSSKQLRDDLDTALKKIKDAKWQQKYNNGFHLIMLYNHANILHFESRILANFVIWEWLFAHLHGNESTNLREIFSFIVCYFWRKSVGCNIFNKRKHNIFVILRNQLSHSGRFPPIDRKQAETWMTKLSSKEIKQYLDFFDILTQVIVLKTLELNCENRINQFDSSLKRVLKTGK